MSATSCAMTTSMWSLFGQLTHIPTTALHFFFSPSLLSVFPSRRKVQKAGKGGWVCGICWHRLMREKEGTRGRHSKRRTQKEERDQKSCGERWRKYSSCSSSFPLASGKSWCAPLTWSQEACVVTWSPGHVIQKFMGAHCFQYLGERRIFFLVHKNECHSMPNVFSTLNVTQTAFLFGLFPLSCPN